MHMAYAPSRSWNADFILGYRDGHHMSDTPNRGGEVSAPTAWKWRACRRQVFGVTTLC